MIDPRTTAAFSGTRDQLTTEQGQEIRDVFAVLPPGTVIRVGDATGVDALVRELALAGPYQLVVYRANWNAFGNAAGPARNARIVSDAYRDSASGYDVCAFVFPKPSSRSGGRGTLNFLTQWEALGMPFEREDL